MKVTSKGQVTIPKLVREKLGIGPDSEVDFREEGDRVYLVAVQSQAGRRRLELLRGSATVKLTTAEIMSLTRGEDDDR